MAKNKVSPRQRMINLMYLIFIAMLALNVPVEVLDGFDVVNEKLLQSIDNTVLRNNQIYSELQNSYKSNPEKTAIWFNKGQDVKSGTDSIYNLIQSLKIEIAISSDGNKADVNQLKKRDDLSAAPEIMLSPISKNGKKLREALNKYRVAILEQIHDPLKKETVAKALSTEPSKKGKLDSKSWEESYFESMPSIAALTYLSEIQLNIKEAEGEALNTFLKNIDFKDFRVNELNAFVIPQSRFVMRGSTYKSNIVLAAIDTTQRPRIFVNGKELPEANKGLFQFLAGAVGSQTYKGYIETTSRDGNVVQRPFEESYTVMEPMATVAPLLMDVLYAGIDNPISVSVPGVPPNDITVRAEGGTIAVSGNKWNARPSKIGQNMAIIVSAKISGTVQQVERKEFRVRSLPDPTPFIQYADDKGNPKIFKRGLLARSVLLSTTSLKAAIDDGILNIPFTVISFRTFSMDALGNATPEVSDGANFSARQREQIQKLGRGKFFFISGIKAIGPDKIERDLSAIEVRVN